jgi:predicted nucleic acid-binding protein
VVSLYYADTSAVIKLLAEERHSRAFAAFYHADSEWVSSALLRIEVTRAVARVAPALLPDARDLLSAFSYIAIDDDVVDAAMNEPGRALRSPDAIHLATARILAEDLDRLATYDARLAAAAGEAGLVTVSPRIEESFPWPSPPHAPARQPATAGSRSPRYAAGPLRRRRRALAVQRTSRR